MYWKFDIRHNENPIPPFSQDVFMSPWLCYPFIPDAASTLLVMFSSLDYNAYNIRVVAHQHSLETDSSLPIPLFCSITFLVFCLDACLYPPTISWPFLPFLFLHHPQHLFSFSSLSTLPPNHPHTYIYIIFYLSNITSFVPTEPYFITWDTSPQTAS